MPQHVVYHVKICTIRPAGATFFFLASKQHFSSGGGLVPELSWRGGHCHIWCINQKTCRDLSVLYKCRCCFPSEPQMCFFFWPCVSTLDWKQVVCPNYMNKTWIILTYSTCRVIIGQTTSRTRHNRKVQMEICCLNELHQILNTVIFWIIVESQCACSLDIWCQAGWTPGSSTRPADVSPGRTPSRRWLPAWTYTPGGNELF